MQLGVDGCFVGSGIFKSSNPEKRAQAMVQAVTHYNDPLKLSGTTLKVVSLIYPFRSLGGLLYNFLFQLSYRNFGEPWGANGWHQLRPNRNQIRRTRKHDEVGWGFLKKMASNMKTWNWMHNWQVILQVQICCQCQTFWVEIRIINYKWITDWLIVKIE